MSYFRTITLKLALSACLTALLVPQNSHAQDEQLNREIWTGTFKQNGLISWEGPFELYLRYDPEQSYPQDIQGILTWPKLGGARTRVVGKRNEGYITFVEDKCLETSCSSLVLGGTYKGEYTQQQTIIQGSASLGSFGLLGTFKLKRKMLVFK